MTMKAAVIHEFGDAIVLKFEDLERPTPKPGNILIKVLAGRAWSLNIHDTPHVCGAERIDVTER